MKHALVWWISLAASSLFAAEVQVAWFTDTIPAHAAGGTAQEEFLPETEGCCGEGVNLIKAVPVDWPGLRRGQGYLSFWIRPNWNGNDGKQHRFLRLGDPVKNGLLVEKSGLGMLRWVMASPEKVTVARADISQWKAGEWHHVVVAWFSHRGQPVGLPLWLDRVAVDGPVAGGCTFVDPETLADKRLWIGDTSADAAMDELILRTRLDAEGSWGQVAVVYRDYFRSAPYDAIEITPEPLRVPADRRAVAGFAKQFGLLARRQGCWEPVTDYAVRYGQWADFDAKPFIQWTSTDSALARVDKNGRVQALMPGAGAIQATFRGMQARYELVVVPPEKPDLGLICVELLPRYRSDAVKNRPVPGENLTARVRLGNFGLTILKPGAEVRLDLVPVTERDSYRFDPRIKPARMLTATLEKTLVPGEETAVEFRFECPEKPMWMRAQLDPQNRIDEFCEANNDSVERTDARPIQMGYQPKTLTDCLASRKINHVGSLSYYDWIRAQKLRMDAMLRDAVWPTTSPYGVEEAYRVDTMTALNEGNWDEQPYNRQSELFDGGFPINEPVDLMSVDAAIIHEFGHTLLSQPDLYGYSVRASNVLLTDEDGQPYSGTPLMPVVSGDDTLPYSPGIQVACGVGYVSLMDSCHLWLHPAQAGHILYYKGYRQDRFWGTQGRLVPTRAQGLVVTDLEDRPLKGAAVYVYHVFQAPVNDAGAKYFADCPKFAGQTDEEGRFAFPNQTDQGWDDPETDEVDGSVPVWNPFGRVKTTTGAPPDVAFTPNVWTVEGLLLIKIVSGKQVEFRWMDLLEFNELFHSGQTVLGIGKIRTSLPPSTQPTPVVRKEIPKAIRKTNQRPVAIAPAKLTVKCGQEYEIDGSKSRDPEGQPLYYRWSADGHWPRTDARQGPILRLKAPAKPTTQEYRFWVLDGVRCSEVAIIQVAVLE